MTSEAMVSGAMAPRWTALWQTRLLLGLVLLGVLATTGCSGCNSPPALPGATDAENEKKKEPEEKKPLEIGPLLPLVGQKLLVAAEQDDGPAEATDALLVKPGHWTTTVQEMQSNREDYFGTSSMLLVDSDRKPTPLANTNFTFQLTRPVALAKERAKRIESELFVPEQSQGVRIEAALRSRSSGRLEPIAQPVLQKMPSYQYFLVVLSEEISKYAFLKVTDAVRMPWEEEFDSPALPHYRVVLADASQSLPLPSNTLTWSSVSHLVWDEVDPTRMTPEQQTALVDWIHWGGRLVINGPDSLDGLRESFLSEFLPAESTGSRLFTAADLEDFSSTWSPRQRGQDLPPLKPLQPWSGIRLRGRAGGSEIAGSSGLFYERAVGQGTVVLSAIQLTERDFINWPGYDSFLSAVLLRRPARRFSIGPYGGLRSDWNKYPNRRLDAHFTTGLRWFARDANTQADHVLPEVPAADPSTPIPFQTDRLGGLGAWSDQTPVTQAARDILTNAAAVRVPEARMVLACLAIYLAVLVPLNWMVFKTLNRLEWAWIAAPIIAILGTLAIVRQAQLDIGFVRSQTEVALLEIQGTHPRALLSRYTALYSSLSTTYQITYDSPHAVALPFSAGPAGTTSQKLFEVVLEKQNHAQLQGLAVASASTKIVHSEAMVELAGPLTLGQSSRGHAQLINRLGHSLQDVVVVRRRWTPQGAQYESSWIGALGDGESTPLGLRPLLLDPQEIPHQDQRSPQGDQVDVDELLRLAFQFPAGEDPLQTQRDELRVVGRIDQLLPGTQVEPVASQILGATVVLAHLEVGPLPAPTPDVNSRGDVLSKESP